MHRLQAVLQSGNHQDSMVLAQKQTDQWNREPRNGPTSVWPTNLSQSRNEYPMEKDSLFHKWCWEDWTATCRRMNIDHFLTQYTKINSKWMKDLNVRQEAIKILEEKADKNLFDLSRSNFLLNTSLEARETKAKMNYWDLIRIKSFCTVKETISKTKRQPTEWEKTFANDISDKGLVSKIYKNLSNSTPKKQII